MSPSTDASWPGNLFAKAEPTPIAMLRTKRDVHYDPSSMQQRIVTAMTMSLHASAWYNVHVPVGLFEGCFVGLLTGDLVTCAVDGAR